MLMNLWHAWFRLKDWVESLFCSHEPKTFEQMMEEALKEYNDVWGQPWDENPPVPQQSFNDLVAFANKYRHHLDNLRNWAYDAEEEANCMYIELYSDELTTGWYREPRREAMVLFTANGIKVEKTERVVLEDGDYEYQFSTFEDGDKIYSDSDIEQLFSWINTGV